MPRVLGRAELLAAAAAAADAFAAGAPLPGDGETIAGLRFALSLPIGCGGSSGDETTSGWRYDPKAKALRVRAVPARWSPADWTAQGSAEIEAIEGFWIARPWTASEGCPRAAVQEPAPGAIPAPALAVERTLGIAQFFEAGSSRVGRRDGEAFEAVTREAVETLDTSQGFRLRIEGRVTQAPSGQPVICRSAAAGQRPACLISTALDTLAIENIATGETLATWNLSHENAVPSVD